MPEARVSLADELQHLHRSLFHVPLDPGIVQHYQAANAKIFPLGYGSALVPRVISRRLDVEAVEYALRRRGVGGELTKKLQILCYVAESHKSYQREFINFNTRRAGAVLSLVDGLLRTGWKFIKGEYLVHRHGLI